MSHPNRVGREQSTLRLNPARLEGRVVVNGAKNSALRLLAATLLCAEHVELSNYPSALLDIQVHEGMLEALGKAVEHLSDDSVRISEPRPLQNDLVWSGRSIRNTLLILGAVLGRTGRASVPLPGGCRLGERKYDLHVMLLERLGARVWDDGERLHAETPVGHLVGADIHLPMRSTGATENAILAATLARGTTRVWNPHIRPEILDLIELLNGMGAKIRVFGQEHIEITGVEGLTSTSHRVIPDSMEAVTWLAASVITRGDIEIVDFPSNDMEVVLAHLRAAGARLYTGDSSVIVYGGRCYPIEVSTGPHPGINSDVQPILAAWAAAANGQSKIVDLRFPGRYGYAAEMAKMGVASRTEGDLLAIEGRGGQLIGGNVRALDLRAGAALSLCALIADGETVIEDAWQILRGYSKFVEKLRELGAPATYV